MNQQRANGGEKKLFVNDQSIDYFGDAPTQAGSNQALKRRESHSRNSSEEEKANGHKDGSIDGYLDTKIPRVESYDNSSNQVIKTTNSRGGVNDNIRKTSGKELPRHDLPISINGVCLSHQNSGKDT